MEGAVTTKQNSYRPLLIVWKLRADYDQSAIAADIGVVPPGGAPAVATAPHLPFGGDPGTITGWLLDATATATSDMSRVLEQGFNLLVTNLPYIRDAEYDTAIQNLVDEVVCSVFLVFLDNHVHLS